MSSTLIKNTLEAHAPRYFSSQGVHAEACAFKYGEHDPQTDEFASIKLRQIFDHLKENIQEFIPEGYVFVMLPYKMPNREKRGKATDYFAFGVPDVMASKRNQQAFRDKTQDFLKQACAKLGIDPETCKTVAEMLQKVFVNQLPGVTVQSRTYNTVVAQQTKISDAVRGNSGREFLLGSGASSKQRLDKGWIR